MHHTFSIREREVTTASKKSNTYTFCLLGMVMFCWKMQECPRKRHSLDGSICSSKFYPYLSALIIPMILTNPVLWQIRLIRPDSDNSDKLWWSFSSLLQKNTMDVLAKNYIKCWNVEQQDTFWLCYCPFQMTLNSEKYVMLLDKVDVWLLLCIVMP